uniref:phosphotransferase n=1 Tax=Mesorhizobium sp. WSM4875 TaxID=3038539 RepID=UPI002416E654|nr:phosphotransferase [Mesorhizobium sp. WSM4875]WIE94647.1 phosphotransferase [Mesorhizobium sp. WSM4875]
MTATSPAAASQERTAPHADVSTAQAAALAAEHYGIVATAHRLAGEKDSNFRLTNANGEEFLLKIVHPGEDSGLTSMHTSALLHVAERDPTFPVQRVVRTLAGKPEFRLRIARGDERTVRTVTFAKGVMQRDAVHTPAQRFNIGQMLARLQLALADFSHPSDTHPITWDLKNAGGLRSLISESIRIEDALPLYQWIDIFERDVVPMIARLSAQVVHNDLSSDNIVVDPADTDQVAGIIDFGDMVRTLAMFDLAVGAAYQLTEATDPLAAAQEFIRGFHAVKPISEVEASVLFKTIMTRMVMRIAITEWRAVKFPENRKYILRNTPQVWHQFGILSGMPEGETTSKLIEMLR